MRHAPSRWALGTSIDGLAIVVYVELDVDGARTRYVMEVKNCCGRRTSGAAEDRPRNRRPGIYYPLRLEPCARRLEPLFPSHPRSMDRPFAHHVQSSLTSVQRTRLKRAPNVGSGLPGPDAPPWYCAGGALAGKYLKADVEEVQKPDMTRKVSSNLTRTGGGSRDARPLAPPPIVRVRLWECTENGDKIREVDMKCVYVLAMSVSWYAHAHILRAGAPIHSVEPGLLCNAVLFPYNHAYDTDPSIAPHDHPGPSPILPATAPAHPYLARESTPVPPTLPRRPNRELPDGLSMRHDLEGCRDKQCEIIQAFREDEGVQAAYFVFDDLKVKERGQ